MVPIYISKDGREYSSRLCKIIGIQPYIDFEQGQFRKVSPKSEGKLSLSFDLHKVDRMHRLTVTKSRSEGQQRRIYST